jgi:hypothetical protein
MKVSVRVTKPETVEISDDDIINYAENVIRKDSDLEQQWINSKGMLEYEEHTSHSYYVQAGKPSEKQIVASELLKALKLYKNAYLNRK